MARCPFGCFIALDPGQPFLSWLMVLVFPVGHSVLAILCWGLETTRLLVVYLYQKGVMTIPTHCSLIFRR